MAGDILGHEFLGEVVEVGSEVKKIRRGDRVVVGSVIGCGECEYSQQQSWSLCDNSNPNAYLAEKGFGASGAGIFGYSHAFGGYAGGHAEYIRVPFADNGAFVVPGGIRDESALFCSDALPTGYMAADLCDIRPGDVVAVWGCGGVGLMAMQSARLMGAEKVIAIDYDPHRLAVAKQQAGVDYALDFKEIDIQDALKEITAGRGPGRCIDAVGMEAVSTGYEHFYDRTKQFLRQENDRPPVLRQAIVACRKGGTVSIVGVYSGFIDKFPMGAAMNKGLTFKMGQQHSQKYVPRLLEHLQRGEPDPAYLLTHRMPLERGQEGYDLFTNKEDNCLRVVFAPAMAA